MKQSPSWHYPSGGWCLFPVLICVARQEPTLRWIVLEHYLLEIPYKPDHVSRQDPGAYSRGSRFLAQTQPLHVQAINFWWDPPVWWSGADNATSLLSWPKNIHERQHCRSKNTSPDRNQNCKAITLVLDFIWLRDAPAIALEFGEEHLILRGRLGVQQRK